MGTENFAKNHKYKVLRVRQPKTKKKLYLQLKHKKKNHNDYDSNMSTNVCIYQISIEFVYTWCLLHKLRLISKFQTF